MQRSSTSSEKSTVPGTSDKLILDSGSGVSREPTLTTAAQQTNQKQQQKQEQQEEQSQPAGGPATTANKENNQVQLSTQKREALFASSDQLEIKQPQHEQQRLLGVSAQLIADDSIKESGRSQTRSNVGEKHLNQENTVRPRQSLAHPTSTDSLNQEQVHQEHEQPHHKKQEVEVELEVEADCLSESNSHDEAQRLIPSVATTIVAGSSNYNDTVATNNTLITSNQSGLPSASDRCCLDADCDRECTQTHRERVDFFTRTRRRGSGPVASMSTRGQTTKLIPAYFVAELIGTFMLVIIGDGAIGAYILTKRQVDIFCACFAFGVGAMIATFTSGKISGAHLNPAASFAFALDGRLMWKLVPVYLVAQYSGGFLAALVLYLNYSEAISSLDGGQHSAYGQGNSTGGIFATYPAPYVTVWGSLLDQIVGTAVLLFAISAVSDKNNAALEDRHQPLIVAFVIGLTCVAFSPNCGAIFNPARDLSPRLITALFGYPAVWEPLNGTYWLLAGIVGPHIGAIIGVFSYKYLIGCALQASERHAESLLAPADLHHTTGFIGEQKYHNHNNNNNNTSSDCFGHQQQPAQRLATMARYQMCQNQDRRHVHTPGDYGAAAPTTATTCP